MQKVVRVCDLHEGTVPAVGRLDYSLEGKRTALDLCADHLVLVRRSLDEVVGAAGSRVRQGAAGGRVPGSRRELSTRRETIRAWARENGFGFADRGRVPSEAVEAYERAHSQPIS